MKKILILNGSFCEQPIIEKAKEMGFYVVTSGNAPELMGHKYADEYIPADYSDKEAVLKIVKENNIEGIISCANDFGVITAAYVAEKMGWKGHDTYENAMLIHHKDSFKKYCEEHNIPSPKTISFFDKKEAYQYVETCEYPIIVKANDLTGGKGIHKAFEKDEAIEAMRKTADIIILDTPPSAMLADAEMVVKYADTAIYVVMCDYARSFYVQKGIRELAETGIDITGVILNAGEQASSSGYGTYGKYGYYGKSES